MTEAVGMPFGYEEIMCQAVKSLRNIHHNSTNFSTCVNTKFSIFQKKAYCGLPSVISFAKSL